MDESEPGSPVIAEMDAMDAMDADACAAALASLFEGAPRFLARLCDARPFGHADGLFASARRIAHAMPVDDQLELIDAHPRLGASAERVSAMSYVEQGYDREAAATLAEGGAAELARIAAELDGLNRTYEARFGFRYCVFVAGRSRAALLPEFEAALSADPATELTRALDAVIDIGADRWHKLAPS